MKKHTDTRKSKDEDDEEFQILLSKEDYDELKKCEKKLKEIETLYNEKMTEWENEKEELTLKVKDLVTEIDEISFECSHINENMQSQYNVFLTLIERMRKSCNLQFNQNQSSSNIQRDKSIIGQNSNIAKESLSAIERVVSSITTLLGSTISPIEALLTGHKLTNEALNKENERCERELEELKKRYEQSIVEQATIQKQHEFELAELKNDLIQEQSTIKSLEAEISELRQYNTQLIAKLNKIETLKIKTEKEGDLLSEQNHQLHQEIKELQEENKEYQEHIKILKESIQVESRSKQSKCNEDKVLKKPTNNGSPLSPTKGSDKFQKESFIKETLIEYSREIRNNLIAIGNLSQDEIKEIGVSELKTLVKFIHELEEDFE